jgi:hypothetical protein
MTSTSRLALWAMMLSLACERELPAEKEPEPHRVGVAGPGTSLSDAEMIANRVWAASLESGEAPCVIAKDSERRDWLVRPTEQHDMWGTPFVLVCVGADVEVRSSGPDRSPSTADDLRVFVSRSGVSILSKGRRVAPNDGSAAHP